MKWLKWKKELKPKTLILAPDTPFTINWQWPVKELQVTHKVIHSPYPRPTQINVWAITKDGRRWQLPPYYCRGGNYHSLYFPTTFEDDPFVKIEMDIRYDDLSSG